MPILLQRVRPEDYENARTLIPWDLCTNALLWGLGLLALGTVFNWIQGVSINDDDDRFSIGGIMMSLGLLLCIPMVCNIGSIIVSVGLGLFYIVLVIGAFFLLMKWLFGK